MKIKVQIVAAINNTSPRDREVRTDEFITSDDKMEFPDNHRQMLEELLNKGYSIESIALMNETQSRIIQNQALPQSMMFTGFELEDIETILAETNPSLLR